MCDTSISRKEITVAITRVLVNIQNTMPEVIPVFRPKFSDWELVDQKVVPNGHEAVYQYMAGDPQFPATVRLGCYSAKGRQNLSAKLDTFVTITDDLAETVKTEPWSAVVAISGPEGQALNIDSSAGSWAALSNLLLFSFAPHNVTPLYGGGAATQDPIHDRLKFAVPTVDLGSLDDPDPS